MAGLCLSLTEATIEENLRLIKKNKPFVDLCELRIDYLKEEEHGALPLFPEQAGLPVILTLRGRDQGGLFEGDGRDFDRICTRALRGNYSYVDIDSTLDAPETENLCGKRGITIIRSVHDFTGIPENCGELLRRLPKHSGEIPKIACMIATTADLFRLRRIGAESGHSRQIIIGMGDFGIPTRLLPDRFGSMLSYSTAGTAAAAPGHLPPEKMTNLFRFREIDPETKLFGIIGNPVLHSKSPEIHNPGLKAAGLNAVYIPFPVDDPELFFTRIRDLGGRGFSITVPHKVRTAGTLARRDKAVDAIGSCNTAVWNDRDREWIGYNTDAAGFYGPLKGYADVHGRKIQGAAVIGAGGAARAVVYALRQAEIETCVVNRTEENAEKLAAEFGIPWAGLNGEGKELVHRYSDLIVQTTSVGMTPDTEGDPWPDFRFSGDELVYECIYTPKYTTFLSRAKESGCDVITGDRMLRCQAEEQFILFTGKRLNT